MTFSTYASKWERVKKYSHEVKFKCKLNKEKHRLESITHCPYNKDKMVKTHCWGCPDFVRQGRSHIVCCHARAKKKDFEI